MDQTSKEPSKMKMAEESHLVWIQKRDSVTTYHFDSMAQLSALVFVSQSTSPDSLVRRSIFIVYRSPRNLFSLRNSPAGYSGRFPPSFVSRCSNAISRPTKTTGLSKSWKKNPMCQDVYRYPLVLVISTREKKKKEQSFWDSVTTLMQW